MTDLADVLAEMTSDDLLYHYSGTIKRWVDGDTVDLIVDLGFTVSVNIRARLWGIDTPERGQAGYAEATAEAVRLAPEGLDVRLSSLGLDKYGRWLAVIFANGIDVNAHLVQEGFAVEYFGGTK